MDTNMGFNVEEAPGFGEIDNLLGLLEYGDDSSSSDSSNGSSGLGYKKEDLVDLDVAHVSIPKKDVINVLGISSLLSSGGENSFEGKVTSMKIENGVVRFLLSDNKRYVDKEVDILNEKNQFEGFIAFNSSFLARTIKACNSIVTFIQREVEGEKKYSLKIIGGEIGLDSIKMDESKFNKPITCKNSVSCNKEPIITSAKRLYGITASSIRSGKSINFFNKSVQSSSINSTATIEINEPVPDFKLPLTDVKILTGLCSFDESATVNISTDGSVFEGSSFKFKTESFQITLSSMDAVASRMFDFDGAVASLGHLTQINDLAYGLDSSTGNVRFNYEDGFVSFEIVSKRDNSKVIINGVKSEAVQHLEGDVEISSISLRGALSVFSGYKDIGVVISPDGVALFSGNIKVAILGNYLGKK